MKILLAVLLIPLFSLFVFIVWARLEGPFGRQNSELIVNVSDNDHMGGEKLRVLSWNVAWGYGLGSEGKDYVPKSRQHFLDKLDEMARVIRESGADIVLLQELDFDSDKSHRIDQLKYLSDALGMNRAYAVSWDHNYLPFPYWPPAKHFKRVSSGGGILSRFPITANKVVLWDKPKANAWWYNLFYLYRYSQFTKVRVNGKERLVVNNHLEAFDMPNRRRQIIKLGEMVPENGKALIVGGDFNTTPPSAVKKSNFPNYPKDNYQGDESYDILVRELGVKDALSVKIYSENESQWFSFPSNAPDRKLDYIFYGEALNAGEFEVIQTPASDHLPILAKFELVDVDN